MVVSLLFLTQSFYQTPKIIRQNTRYFIILKLSGARDLSMILKELSISKTKDDLLKMYEYATRNKFDCFIIDNEKVENKLRKNFTEYLDWNRIENKKEGIQSHNSYNSYREVKGEGWRVVLSLYIKKESKTTKCVIIIFYIYKVWKDYSPLIPHPWFQQFNL